MPLRFAGLCHRHFVLYSMNCSAPAFFSSRNSNICDLQFCSDLEIFDPSITLEDIKWLKSVWNGKLLIKGVQSVGYQACAANFFMFLQ